MRIPFLILFLLPWVVNAQSELYLMGTEEAGKYAEFRKRIDLKNPDIAMLEACIFHLTNAERERRKIPRMEWNQNLQESARFHASYLTESKTFSHYNRAEPQFRQASQRIQHFSSNRYNATGENIAQRHLIDYDYVREYVCKEVGEEKKFYYWKTTIEIEPLTYWSFAEEVVKSWMDSKGHRTNILYKYFDEMGVGIQLLPEEDWDDMPGVNVVQNFGGKN